jgi:3',5'-cyclic AMP phosphodiesterase CpdA
VRTIAHISDLHFGRIDPPVAKGLIEDLQRHSPTLLVASGDFTQRARAGQYREAADYLTKLPRPQLVVPGNHDIPLWNIFRRFFFPLTRYRKFISDNLFPEFKDDRLLVLAVNTARSFTRTSGWLNPDQIAHLQARSAAAPAGLMKVLVTHHPFIAPPRKPDADVLLGAEQALPQLEQCGFDVLLAGHLHLAYHDDVRSAYPSARRSVLSIQAGTATSTRRRGEPNAYNWITLSPDVVSVAVRAWDGQAFEESLVTRYERIEGSWRGTTQVPVDQMAVDALQHPPSKH